MAASVVTTPDGTRWTVRRRWIPHREGRGVVSRFRKHSKRDAADFLDVPFDFDGGFAGLAIAIALIALVALMLVFGWPLLLLGFDLLWLLLVGGFGVIGRIVLRRPWRVEAVGNGERLNWFVHGFRAAGRQRDEIARQLRHGQKPIGAQASSLPH